MSSPISAGFTPLSRARPTCAAICAVFPVETIAETVTRLRSRGASSFRSQTSPNRTSSVKWPRPGATSYTAAGAILRLLPGLRRLSRRSPRLRWMQRYSSSPNPSQSSTASSQPPARRRPAKGAYARCCPKKSAIRSNGILSIRSYRSVWLAPGMIISSFGSAAAAKAVSAK